MREAGFIVSANSTVGLTTSWSTGILLSVVSASAANSKAPPACVHIGDLEIDLGTISGATAIQAVLTYDSAGVQTMSGPSAFSTFANLSAAIGQIALAIDKTKTWPAADTVGQCYLWLRLDAGTANLSAGGARLQWRDPGV